MSGPPSLAPDALRLRVGRSHLSGLALACAMAASACADRGDTGITLRVESPEDMVPTHLELVWLNPERELMRRRVPGRGALARPRNVAVMIEIDGPAGGQRIAVVRGYRASALVSEGVGKGVVESGRWSEVIVSMRRAPLPDQDGDGIPDDAGFCPPSSAPCGPRPDGGAPDAAVERDAEPAVAADADTPAAPDAGVERDTAPEAPTDTAPERASPEPRQDGPAPSVDTAPKLDVRAEALPLPPDAAPPPMDTRPRQTGLRATYFDDVVNHELTGEAFTRIDPLIDFDWNADPPIEGDQFGVRWEAQVRPAFSESYTIGLEANDLVRLWWDGQLIIDSWVSQPFTTHTATVDVAANRGYSLLVEYISDDYEPEIRLFWSSRSQQPQIIPEDRLTPSR